MADNVTLPGDGAAVATDDVAGVQFQRVKVTLGGNGVDGGDVAAGNPLPVSVAGSVVIGASVDVSGSLVSVTGSTVAIAGTVPVSGPLTDAQLRAAAVAVTGGLTDAQLRATAVPVSGTFWQATQPVSGPLTDAQLRAAAVAVSGTFWQATQPVSGPLTDTQLRATAVPVSGPLTDAQLRAAAVPVSGPLTDAQLRASAVPVTSAAATTGTLSNVAGTATSTTLLASNSARRGATIWNDSTSILYVRLSSGTASATSCTVKLVADAYYEVPFGYTGAITGVWASATGSARITEVS